MSQKLFHKLQQSTYCGPLKAQEVSNQVVEDLINKCTDRFQELRYNKLNTISLSKEIVFRNTNNFNQAYIPNPLGLTISQDPEIKSVIYDKIRPYSTKVEKIYIQNPKRNVSKRIIRSSSLFKSTKSSMIFKKQGSHFTKTQQKIFFQLEKDKSTNDNQTEQYIAFLRKKKISQENQNNLKQQFIKTSALENDQYLRLNKKFVQSMGNKNFYYNKNGQVAQINKTNKNLVKRSEKKPIILKLDNPKRKNQKDKRQIIVEFKGKQNLVKKIREEIALQDSNTLLFYKSNNCTYNIVQQKNHQA